MTWPLATDYAVALQNPRVGFKDTALRKCQIARDTHNQPLGMSGAFAVVYQATLENGDRIAVRAFTSGRDGRKECYQSISDYIGKKRLNALVGFTYLEEGIRSSDGKFYPLVTMDWVPGSTLFHWVKQQCEQRNGRSLRTACDRWTDLVNELAAAKIAHGDLQHANVLVTAKGELKLVDYDCMCVPTLVGRPNLEIGVKPYQHPGRDEHTLLSPRLDNFSALFILVALRALAAKPGLWGDFVEKTNYDKLLIREDDFEKGPSSTLYQQLTGPVEKVDAEVGRLSRELFELYHSDMDTVPFLQDVLFSYDKVRSLLSKRLYDEAVAMLRKRGKANGVPPNLVGAIREAEQRVECLIALKAAVLSGDEAEMEERFRPNLLKDYPAAKQYFEVAQHATKVMQLQAQLADVKRHKKWRDFIRVWDTHRSLLDTRASCNSLKSEVEQWRKRNSACDRVLKLIKQANGDPDQLSREWETLSHLGGHPEADPHRQLVEKTILRHQAWRVFQQIPRDISQQSDTKVAGSWKEDLFQGWKTAEDERARVQGSRQRLAIVAQLQQLSGQQSTVSVEEKIKELGSQLRGYDYDLASRVADANGRLEVYAEAKKVLIEPALDTKIAAAAQRLEQMGALVMLDAQSVSRVQLAKQRAPLISALKQIPLKLSPDLLDQKILACWRPDLLNDCYEAKQWKETYETAIKRRDLIANLKKAVTANDESAISRLIQEPCLENYPFERVQRGLSGAIETTIRRIRRGQALITALQGNNPAEFFEHFDYTLLKQSGTQFAQYRGAISELVRQEILPYAKNGLAPKKLGASSLVKQGGMSHAARWAWPSKRFTDQCLVVVCRNKPKLGDDPRKMNVALRIPVSRNQFEDASGRVIIHAKHHWNRYYVAVWAMIDVGFEAFASEPVVLGRLDVASAVKSDKGGGKRWGLV